MTSEKNPSSADIQFVTPELQVHTFTHKVMDTDIYFQVTKLDQSFCLWIGSGRTLSELSVAMKSVKSESDPCSTVLVGRPTVSSTSPLAERLCKRTGKQVFVGGDLTVFDQMKLPMIEKKVIEELNKFPEKF